MAKSPKNLASFRATHDPEVIVPGKIDAALTALAAEGPEAWEYEDDFRKRAGVSPAQMAQYRDRYTDHQVQVRSPSKGSGSSSYKKWVWIGNAKNAAKFRAVPGV